MEDLEGFEFIKGYENLYKINSQGVIYSCKHKKIIKNNNYGSKYKWVILIKNFIRKKFYVHRLIAIQWIPNPENKKQIDHIDRNKFNNCLENLRWVTNQENSHNKANYYKNLTDEQLEERKNKKKLYNKNYRDKKKLLKKI